MNGKLEQYFVQYENIKTLEQEISEFITERSALMMEHWAEFTGKNNAESYSTYVHWSVSSLHVVLALFAISCQVNKRRVDKVTASTIKSYTEGVFSYKLNLNLDKIIFEKNFKDSSFIDQCFADNLLCEKAVPEIQEMNKFVIEDSGEPELNFALRVLRHAPARWFDCDYAQLDALVDFCLRKAITGAKMHKNSSIVTLGPKEITGTHMVKILGRNILEDDSWVTMFNLEKYVEKGNSIKLMRESLTLLNQSQIDYMLVDTDDVF